MIQKALTQPDAKVVYADEDVLDRNGRRSQHHFKPDWNYDFQLSTGYLGNAWLIKTDHLVASGGRRSAQQTTPQPYMTRRSDASRR